MPRGGSRVIGVEDADIVDEDADDEPDDADPDEWDPEYRDMAEELCDALENWDRLEDEERMEALNQFFEFWNEYWGGKGTDFEYTTDPSKTHGRAAAYDRDTNRTYVNEDKVVDRPGSEAADSYRVVAHEATHDFMDEELGDDQPEPDDPGYKEMHDALDAWVAEHIEAMKDACEDLDDSPESGPARELPVGDWPVPQEGGDRYA